MTSRHVFLTFVLVAALDAHAARADNAQKLPARIALLPLIGEGIGGDEVARVERTLQIEVDAKFGSGSVAENVVRTRLDESSAKGLHCDRNQTSCLVQLGIVTGADRVLLPVLASKGASSTLTLRLVDVASVDQLAAASADVRAEPTRDDVRALLARLDDPAAKLVRLVVRGPPGAEILIDGNARGRLPMEPLDDVAPGKHVVTIDGPRRIETVVDVRRGEDVVVDAPTLVALAQSAPKETEPGSAPPTTTVTSSSLPWIGIAGGGAAVLVGSVALVAGLYPRVQYDNAATRLSRIESEIGGDPVELAARADDVRKARSDLDGAGTAWQTWGEPLSIGAGLVVVAGAAAAAAGGLGLVE